MLSLTASCHGFYVVILDVRTDVSTVSPATIYVNFRVDTVCIMALENWIYEDEMGVPLQLDRLLKYLLKATPSVAINVRAPPGDEANWNCWWLSLMGYKLQSFESVTLFWARKSSVLRAGQMQFIEMDEEYWSNAGAAIPYMKSYLDEQLRKKHTALLSDTPEKRKENLSSQSPKEPDPDDLEDEMNYPRSLNIPKAFEDWIKFRQLTFDGVRKW